MMKVGEFMNSTVASYLYLLGAILFEIAGTTSLKLSQGFSRLLPSIAIFVFYAVSFTLFSFALKQIDVSTGCAIWSALGTALIATIGVLYCDDSPRRKPGASCPKASSVIPLPVTSPHGF
jgi:small multidrug resistance pump